MSDDNPTPEAPEVKADDWKAPASQDELNSIIEKRLARERARFADYEDIKSKAEQFDKAQESSKTELEKLTERAAKAEADAQQARLDADRNSVALVKGLTPTQAKRLVGNTREELESDADELLKDLDAKGDKAPRAPQQKTKQTDPKADPERDFARKLFKRAD